MAERLEGTAAWQQLQAVQPWPKWVMPYAYAGRGPLS